MNLVHFIPLLCLFCIFSLCATNVTMYQGDVVPHQGLSDDLLFRPPSMASQCKAQSQKATIPADRSTKDIQLSRNIERYHKDIQKINPSGMEKNPQKNENTFITLIPLCDGLQQAYLKLSSVFPKRRDPVVPTSKR